MTGIERLRKLANELDLEEMSYECLELREIADQIERETLPRPRFEDGEPVQFGDECAFERGVDVVNSITLYGNGRWHVLGRGVYGATSMDGPLKRPEPPDTWERIEADAKKGYCVYFGRKYTFDCSDGESDACPLSGLDYECEKRKAQDIVRRCKKLAGVE